MTKTLVGGSSEAITRSCRREPSEDRLLRKASQAWEGKQASSSRASTVGQGRPRQVPVLPLHALVRSDVPRRARHRNGMTLREMVVPQGTLDRAA